jgi:hypothetical protein
LATNDKDTGGRWTDNLPSFETLKQAVFWAGVAKDVYYVGKAIHTDCTETDNKRPGKGTIKAVSSVVLGRATSAVCSKICEGVGNCFGEFGAQSGRIVGGLVGTYVGSSLAKGIVDRNVPSDF